MGPKVLAWNGLGGYSFPRFSPSGSCTFSDHHMDNLTSQLYLFWYRNLSDFKTIKEYSSRRQAVVFEQYGYRCEGKFEGKVECFFIKGRDAKAGKRKACRMQLLSWKKGGHPRGGWGIVDSTMLENRKEQKCSVYPFYKNFPLPDSKLNSRISYLSFHRKACKCSEFF